MYSSKIAARLFISYAHADRALARELYAALAGLRNRGLIVEWIDWDLAPGDEWELTIQRQLSQADLVIFLVSSDFLNSDFVRQNERPIAFQRFRHGQCRILPVIARSCDWKGEDFASLQVLPTQSRAVEQWTLRSDAWTDVVQGIGRVLGAPVGSYGEREIPFQAPVPPEPFVGRDWEISELRRLVESSRVTFIRGGLGGVGKTALAACIAAKLRPQFQDGVLWAQVDAEDQDSIATSFYSALNPLGLPSFTAQTSTIARVRQCLVQLNSRKCLVVLDNATGVADIQPWLAHAGNSRFLITTRYSLAKSFSGAVELPLSVLSPDSAIALLRSYVRDRHSPEIAEVQKLVEVIGCLPLAIRIAAGIMTEMQWSAASYLQRLLESRSLEWLSNPDGPELSFALSYNTLAQSAAKTAFRAMGAFQELRVKSEVLARAAGMQVDRLELSVLELSRRGLLWVNTDRTLEMHPLMNRFAYELLDAAGETAAVHGRTGQFYRERIAHWDPARESFAKFGSAAEEDALSGLAAASHFIAAGRFSHAQQVLEAVGDVLTRRGSARRLLDLLATIRQKEPLNPWLEIYWADLTLDFPAPNPAVEEAEARLRTLSDSLMDKKIASAAVICRAKRAIDKGRLDDAKALLETSLNFKRHMVRTDDRGIAYVLNALGRVALKKGEHAERALDLHHEALQMLEFLKDDQGIAYTLRRIGSIQLWVLNQPKIAIEHLQRAEQLATDLSFNAVLITVLLEKAEALRRMGHFKRAVETLERALRLSSEDDDPLSEARVLRRMATIFEQVQFIQKAHDCALRSLELFGESNGFARRNLRAVLARLERLIKALRNEEAEIEARISDMNREPSADKEGLRILRRRRKRIRQKLGLEPAMIRVGNG